MARTLLSRWALLNFFALWLFACMMICLAGINDAIMVLWCPAIRWAAEESVSTNQLIHLVLTLQNITVLPILAAVAQHADFPASLATDLAAEIGLQYQIPDTSGCTRWCVGSLDLNIGRLTCSQAVSIHQLASPCGLALENSVTIQLDPDSCPFS